MGQPGNNVIWKITFILKSASIIAPNETIKC